MINKNLNIIMINEIINDQRNFKKSLVINEIFIDNQRNF